MRQVVDAVFEHGVFRPITPLKLVEGESVRLTVDPKSIDKAKVEEILAAAASVYDGLTPEEIADVERIALDRSNFSVGRNTP